jgi:hypothetical protein
VWHDYGDIKDVSRVVDETARKITIHAVQGTLLAGAELVRFQRLREWSINAGQIANILHH